MPTSASLLLVEDNEDDVFIMKRSIESAGIENPVQVVEDGQQAIDFLSGAGEFQDRVRFPMPALVFLDLKLPLKSGFDVLNWIRSKNELSSLVVVVLTSSDLPRDINLAYQLGANSYLVKPPTREQLIEMAKAFKWYWLQYNRFESVSA